MMQTKEIIEALAKAGISECRMNLIKKALGEVGTMESPLKSNRTKYGKWFGLDGVMWCGIFVSYVYFESGCPLGKIGYWKGFAGCETAQAHFKASGEITKDPQPGDIVLYDWQGDGKSDHTGIFIMWLNKEKTRFLAVEGNTGPASIDNGGTVAICERNSNRVLCFVSPKVLAK